MDLKMANGTKAPDFDGTQPCKDIDLELFFPESQLLEIEALKKIKPLCKTCNFSASCLKWALDNRERGIWAGTGEEERKLILRRINRVKV
jgi:hypothetical protein